MPPNSIAMRDSTGMSPIVSQGITNVPQIRFEHEEYHETTESGLTRNTSSSSKDSSLTGPERYRMEFVVHIDGVEGNGWPRKSWGVLTYGFEPMKVFGDLMKQIYGAKNAMLDYKLKFFDLEHQEGEDVEFNDDQILNTKLWELHRKLAISKTKAKEQTAQLQVARSDSETSYSKAFEPKIECHAWYPDPAVNTRSELERLLTESRRYMHQDVMAGCFVPESQLETILSEDRVRNYFFAEEVSRSQQHEVNLQRSREIADLAAAVYEKGRHLLATFLLGGIDSHKFERAWKRKQTDANLPWPRENHDKLYLEIAEIQNVFLMQWQTLAVVFERLTDYQAPNEYVKEVCLPIIDKQYLGMGSYGTVSKILIEPGHQKLYKLHGEPNPQLALKEFRKSSRVVDWDREATILHQIRELNHPHLIQLLTAFRHGDDCYMILPLADCSLEDVFKNDDSHQPNRQHRDYMLWMLKQLRGLADGLKEFHEISPRIDTKVAEGLGAPAQAPRRAYHHDIKPANILLFKRLEPEDEPNSLSLSGLHAWEEPYGRLQITDLGLGKIREPDSKSHTRTLRGTPTYAAPETAQDGLQGVQADIWALACVLLEVMVWLMEGKKGYENFSNARLQPSAKTSGPAIEVDAFWVEIADKKFEVCPAARLKVDTMRQAANEDGAGPIRIIMDLITRCWDFNRHTRPKADAVVQELDKAIEAMKAMREDKPPFKEQGCIDLLLKNESRRRTSLQVQTWPTPERPSPPRPSSPARHVS